MNRHNLKEIVGSAQPLVVTTGIISLIALLAVLNALSYLFIPLAFAIFLTYIFHPLITILERNRVPQKLGVVIVLSLVIILIYVSSILLFASVSSIGDKGEFYTERLKSLVSAILAPFNYTLTELLKLLKIQFDSNLEGALKSILSSGIIQDFLGKLSGTINEIILTLLFFVFMISGKSEFDRKVRMISGGGGSGRKNLLITIESQIQKYLIIKSLISFILALLISVIYLWFGVDLAIFWGIITFIFNFIPNIGALFATAAPVVMIFLQFGFSLEAALLISVTVGLHFLSGNIIEPVYIGKYLDLSPVFVLFSLFLWGFIWGLPGMFLSVPIAAIIKIVLMNSPSFSRYSVIIGGRMEKNVK